MARKYDPIRFISAAALRGIVRGNYYGIKTTKAQQKMAKKELKRRGLKIRTTGKIRRRR